MTFPYLRCASGSGASEPCPPGCIAEPAGRWRGRSLEVVYNPRRYAIVFLRGESAAVEDGLRTAGWQRHAIHSDMRMWVRDRSIRAHRVVAERGAALGPPGLA